LSADRLNLTAFRRTISGKAAKWREAARRLKFIPLYSHYRRRNLLLYLRLRALNFALRSHDARIGVRCADKILKFTAA